MEFAESAASLETKSSAGDKYETGRAMLHLERERAASLLQTNRRLLEAFRQIKFNTISTECIPGALLELNTGYYLFGISIGELHYRESKIITLSLASPLGKALFCKKPEESLIFRDKQLRVLQIV